MKLYRLTIKPLSGFGTPLKGDSIFGHFCWQAAYDRTLVNGGLEGWLQKYERQPLAVFSSAYPLLAGARSQFALKRPDLPLSLLFPRRAGEAKQLWMRQRKEQLSRSWMLVGEDLSFSLQRLHLLSAEELSARIAGARTAARSSGPKAALTCAFNQPHNTINRLTATTGTGMFAPFVETSTFYHPDVTLAIFALIEPAATDIERVCRALVRIGRWGFGKNASTGCGRFELLEQAELALPSAQAANACYTLSPAAPQKGAFDRLYFTPFVRFGKHGDVLVRSANPFKNPVIMADEGAVLVPKERDVFDKPYLGRAIGGISKSMPGAMAQGYSIYLPIRMEACL